MATTPAARKPPTISTKTTPARAPAKAKRQKDACNLLEADLKAVKAMFKEYESLSESRSRSTAKKPQLADRPGKKLTVHAAIENDDLMNEATVGHASAKDLFAQIKSMDPADKLFDAKVMVLGDRIDPRIKEQRAEMFIKARASKLNSISLAGQRKEELMAQEDQEIAMPAAELAEAL